MPTDELRANERIRGAKERKAKRDRHLAWRAKFHTQQAIAKKRVSVLLGSSHISKTDWTCLYVINNNRRGPRMDQIKRVDKLWFKYGYVKGEG